MFCLCQKCIEVLITKLGHIRKGVYFLFNSIYYISVLYLEKFYAAYYYDAITLLRSPISISQLAESVMLNTCLPIILQLTSLSSE